MAVGHEVMGRRDAAPAEAVGAVGEPDDPLVDSRAAVAAQAARLEHVGTDIDEAGGFGEAADVVQAGGLHHQGRGRQEA